ncbi:hypothetical protein R1sor_015563 [Riccia sorocarpa]|uniref:Carboxypeptidase n=1 Tax=Riccia sorocarpa TaxID=122646 RepID=A0ABD3HIQ6_9MARC
MVKKWAAAAAAVLCVLQFVCFSVEGGYSPHLVKDLPGLPPVKYEQYAGYVTVNKANGRNQFYWFITADNKDAASLPLAIWLNGGPGCSSVGNGLLGELGPFYVTRDKNMRVVLTPHKQSWVKAANIIFLESPVGVGFSYSDTPSDYDTFTDARTAEDNLQFLLGWLELFPEYKSNDFYLLGESYAGHYVPTFAREIVNYNDNKGPNDLYINFKGFAVGNPWVDAYINNLGATQWWRSHSLISEATSEAVIKYCDFANDSPVLYNDTNGLCSTALNTADADMAYINPYSIYEATCNHPTGNFSQFARFKRKERGVLRVGSTLDPCAPDPVGPYLNSVPVKNAIHAKPDIIWSGCSDVVTANYSGVDVKTSMLPIFTELSQKNLKMWIYNGDTDSVCPTTTAELAIRALNFTVQIPWYPWNHSSQVGGFTEVYKELTYTTVRGAGHFVPYSQPGRSLALFKHFLAGKPLPAFH